MTKYEGIVYDLDEEIYHAHPALSSTNARLLLDSPARYHYAQSHPQEHKDAFDLGTAVHTKVLGTGSPVITFPDEHLTPSGGVSTKAATAEWVAEQRANGLIVITNAQFELANGMAEAVLAHPTARNVFEMGGNPEVSIFGTDPETGVECRARLDWRGPYNADLKTTAKSASRLEFERTVTNFGYDTQAGWYDDTERFATGEDEKPFLFIVVETAPPHLVGIHQLDVVFRDMGHDKARRAREIFAECTATSIWPGYPEEVQLISPPVYAVIQHQEKYE